MTEKKKMGRPKGSFKPVPKDHADAIVEWIGEGKTLRDYCRQPGSPAFRTVYDWIDKDPSFAARFAKARLDGFDQIAQECFSIADEAPPIDDKGKTDSGYVSWQKNRIWTRMQLLARWDPKRYSERQQIDHTSSDGSMSVVERLARGRKRLAESDDGEE